LEQGDLRGGGTILKKRPGSLDGVPRKEETTKWGHHYVNDQTVITETPITVGGACAQNSRKTGKPGKFIGDAAPY